MHLERTPYPTTPEAAEFRRAVEEVFKKYSSANIRADANAWIDLWDEDGIKMGPDSPATFGKKSIAERKCRAIAKSSMLNQNIIVEETKVFGDLGFGRGTYTAVVGSETGEVTEKIDGKFLTLFRKQVDGSWKIYRDCYNSNVSRE